MKGDAHGTPLERGVGVDRYSIDIPPRWGFRMNQIEELPMKYPRFSRFTLFSRFHPQGNPSHISRLRSTRRIPIGKTGKL